MPDDYHSRGGKARAQRLSAEERSAIARRAALARHNKDLPKAIAEGVLMIGDTRISCAVLDEAHGNVRVLTQEGFLTAIGRAPKAKGGEGATVDGKPAFLRAANLSPFISKDLEESTTPIEFVPLRGSGYQGRAFGYKASLLPDVCWVYQDAMVAGKLLPSQKHIGEAARTFLKALTNHAIEDLVDLATGYEDMRKRAAINKIIEKYVEEAARPWVLMFDLDFYRHIFRLNGWEFKPESTARPGVVGRWTNDIYDRLAPGVRRELHRRVRRNEAGRPTQKLTQYLTPEEGKPRLKELLEGVKLLMRMSKTWPEFQARLDEFYPRHDEPPMLPFEGGLYRLPKPD
ncbi:P63C domain-containing protein [Cereibacter sphaeroides]|uniref:P63C domain-containing protein n=1 Tax=Cereibacter sphaeroides TaxID=1063 RepID=UPI0039905552